MDKNTFFSTLLSHYSNIMNTLETMPNLINTAALTQKLISNKENPPHFITQYINIVFKKEEQAKLLQKKTIIERTKLLIDENKGNQTPKKGNEVIKEDFASPIDNIPNEDESTSNEDIELIKEIQSIDKTYDRRVKNTSVVLPSNNFTFSKSFNVKRNPKYSSSNNSNLLSKVNSANKMRLTKASLGIQDKLHDILYSLNKSTKSSTNFTHFTKLSKTAEFPLNSARNSKLIYNKNSPLRHNANLPLKIDRLKKTLELESRTERNGMNLFKMRLVNQKKIHDEDRKKEISTAIQTEEVQKNLDSFENFDKDEEFIQEQPINNNIELF